jgi:hypothetical protein
LNYLPTKNFKLTVNADEVVKNGVIPPAQKSRIADKMEWKFTGNYMTKDNLALMDILAHNNWKRPVCFTTTSSGKDLNGLQQYLYKEGFVYHLIPFKKDQKNEQQAKVNSSVMYDNMMNKFKWGNFKHAKYLDEQSTNLFYPFITATFLELTQGLIQEGHSDLALKALQKYDHEMPDLYPNFNITQSKYFIIDTAYRLHDTGIANKYVASVDSYVTDQLNYNYNLLQTSPGDVNALDVQLGVSVLNGMAELTKDNNQTALNSKLQAQLSDYTNKFSSIVGRQQ